MSLRINQSGEMQVHSEVRSRHAYEGAESTHANNRVRFLFLGLQERQVSHKVEFKRR